MEGLERLHCTLYIHTSGIAIWSRGGWGRAGVSQQLCKFWEQVFVSIHLQSSEKSG